RDGQGVPAAIAADPELTIAQKQSLTQIYETFRRENARTAADEAAMGDAADEAAMGDAADAAGAGAARPAETGPPAPEPAGAGPTASAGAARPAAKRQPRATTPK